MMDHQDLIHPDDGERPDWIIICDAMRPDVFEGLFPAYFSGRYQRVTNGGAQHTPEWFHTLFPETYDAMLFHGGQPIHTINPHINPYDEYEHFMHVPFATLYGHETVMPVTPEAVNAVVRRHLEPVHHERLEALGYTETGNEREFGFHVIRYIAPHAPYRSGPGHRHWSSTKMRERDEEEGDIWELYVDNAHAALEAIEEILPGLDGEVVITADHGECLGDCGDYGHGFLRDAHDHLVQVPWLVVE